MKGKKGIGSVLLIVVVVLFLLPSVKWLFSWEEDKPNTDSTSSTEESVGEIEGIELDHENIYF